MADQLYKGVLKGRFQDGNETRNIFYATSADPEGDVPLAMQGYIAAIVNIVKVGITNLLTFYGVDVYKYIGNEVWQLITAAGLNLTGQETVDALPHQSAAVLIGSTIAGKSKAKKFIPGCSEGTNVGGLVQSAFLATLAGALAAWVTDYVEQMNNATIHPVVHRKGKTDLDFVGGKVDALFGTQRRRKQGVGI